MKDKLIEIDKNLHGFKVWERSKKLRKSEFDFTNWKSWNRNWIKTFWIEIKLSRTKLNWINSKISTNYLTQTESSTKREMS